MRRVEIGDGKRFIPGANAAAIEFVLIGRPPIVFRRNGQFLGPSAWLLLFWRGHGHDESGDLRAGQECASSSPVEL